MTNPALTPATSDQDSQEEITQWVTFKIAGESYGIDVTMVKEVLREIDITPVPGSPYFVLGIINLRGNVVTVIDPRRRFNLPPGEITSQTRIIITESNKQIIGILIDSIAEVVYLEQSQIENTPQLGNDESIQCLQGVTKREEEMLILMDLEKLIKDSAMEASQF